MLGIWWSGVIYGVRDNVGFHWMTLTFWMTYRHIWNTWNLRVESLCRDLTISFWIIIWHWVCHHHSWYRDLAGRADPADKGPPLVHAGIVSRPCHALHATGSITNTFLPCLAPQAHTGSPCSRIGMGSRRLVVKHFLFLFFSIFNFLSSHSLYKSNLLNAIRGQ